jgi:hypothetical protein
MLLAMLTVLPLLVGCASPTQTGSPSSLAATTSLAATPTATGAPTPPPTPTSKPTPTHTPGPNPYITIAQLYLWFNGPGCHGGYEAFDCSGRRTTALTPLLGKTYNSADPAVVRQQIDWAAAYGIDAFSLEWTTPRGIPGSLEENLDDAFLVAPNLPKVRWCIFYDLVLRLGQTPDLNVDLSQGMDFNQPDVANTFVADFGHFAEKYFNQAQYLKIDGRPVVYVWGTWNATGKFADAFAKARQKVRAMGFDVFIVGDIIRSDTFNKALAASYDADTNFTMLMPGLPTRLKDEGQAAVAVDKALTNWQSGLKGLKVTGRKETVGLEPGFAPQFDNRLFEPGNSIYIPALSKVQVTAMAKVVRQHAQPVGTHGWKLVWLNTWNNWPETTTFEPTINEGPKYPAGNYGFDMLEVVREVFGPETFGG